MVYLDDKIMMFIIFEYGYLLWYSSYEFVMDNVKIELVLGSKVIYFIKLEV